MNQDINQNQTNVTQPSQPVTPQAVNTQQPVNPTYETNQVNNQQPVTSNTTPNQPTNNNLMNETPSSGNPKGLILFVVILVIGMGLFLLLDTLGNDKDKESDVAPSPTSTPKITPTPVIDIVEKTKNNTVKETALTAINATRQQLTLANKLVPGDYYIGSNLFENGGTISVLGGNYVYQDLTNCEDKIGSYLCKAKEQLTCSDTSVSFIRVTEENSRYYFSICHTAGAGNKYIDLASENDLLNSSNYSMIK